VIYSVIESCRRRRIEPYTYLKDVLTQLPDMTNRELWRIIPEKWAAERQGDRPTVAAS